MGDPENYTCPDINLDRLLATIPITLPPHNYSVVRYPAPKISRPESWIGRMNFSDTGF